MQTDHDFHNFVKVSISFLKLSDINNTVELKESLDKIWCRITIARFSLVEHHRIDRLSGRLRLFNTFKLIFAYPFSCWFFMFWLFTDFIRFDLSFIYANILWAISFLIRPR